MKNGQPFRCYRCNSVTQYLSTTADATPTPGELTISFECPDCGQRYELQLIPVAIFATSTEGEAQALLHYCSRCGQLYRSTEDEPHMCREKGAWSLDAGRGGEGI
jgi:predicted RNA-binding Zn-ribbon protein involved in translation (DUF1610 family)